METQILEHQIKEKEINLDFLSEMPQKVESAESFDWVSQETLVLIVKAKDFVLPSFQLCGKSLVDWVALATSGCEQKVLEEFDEENIIEELKPFAENYNYVAVFFSDTPLLKHDTFLDVMHYFAKNRLNVLKLPRGYVFKSEFLQSAKILLSTSTFESFGKDDFLIMNSAEKISYAFNVLNARILDYHKSNGVVLLGENTIFIDADVEIESGAIIYANNILKGETYIGKNVILDSGNHIIDTIVCDEAFIRESFLERSKVEVGKIVGPFEKLINKKI